ncbi:MAG TPA: 4-hydroxyphenylpyruvate dioxygenase [Acidobacteriota bacterium]|nr:4-hydroxyphenylpyruvate dioxygenase [Acidobacteriota bacterium]
MSDNPLRLRKIHHVEFWVGNAKQAAFFYRNAFGFSQTGYSGLETGKRDRASYLLEQGKVRFVLSTPLNSDSPLARHINRHGDGVKDIAFHVDDADAAYHEALKRGAESAFEPRDVSDDKGTVRRAAIKTYGDTIHSFISDSDYQGDFLPGFRPAYVAGQGLGILRIDHMVGNVELGKMNYWADWYSKILGFERYITFDDKDISTEYTALMSIVMSDGSYSIKFPINEPARGRKKSQIEEYLDFYEGPGVQHIAMLTDDIVRTVSGLQSRGIDFLTVPDAYYDALPSRVGEIDENIEALRKLGILVDRDEEGYLLQIFTRPVEDRPTLFYEIIERHGSRGFGKGNFKALFESIEREQELRGTL